MRNAKLIAVNTWKNVKILCRLAVLLAADFRAAEQLEGNFPVAELPAVLFRAAPEDVKLLKNARPIVKRIRRNAAAQAEAVVLAEGDLADLEDAKAQKLV